MSKPIFIVKLPIKTTQEQRIAAVNILDKHSLSMEYHTLVIQHSLEEIGFECYNSSHTEIEFEELKKQTIELINKTK